MILPLRLLSLDGIWLNGKEYLSVESLLNANWSICWKRLKDVRQKRMVMLRDAQLLSLVWALLNTP